MYPRASVSCWCLTLTHIRHWIHLQSEVSGLHRSEGIFILFHLSFINIWSSLVSSFSRYKKIKENESIVMSFIAFFSKTVRYKSEQKRFYVMFLPVLDCISHAFFWLILRDIIDNNILYRPPNNCRKRMSLRISCHTR